MSGAAGYPGAVDAVVRNVGRHLRALRRARGVSLGDLARDTGYTTGYLSQVENGASVPSLSTLADVAAALGTDVTAFFPRDEQPPVRISRAGDPDKLRVAPNAREEYTVFTGRGADSAFTALRHRIYPSKELVRYRHVGERFALVLHGQVRLVIGGETHDLEEGDCLHYSSHPEHTMEVTSNGPAEILWLVTPPVL